MSLKMEHYLLVRVTDEGPEFLVRSVIKDENPLHGMGNWNLYSSLPFQSVDDAYIAGYEWQSNHIEKNSPF